MRVIRFRMWDKIANHYFYDREQVMECLKQQVAGIYDHEANGSVFEQFTGLLDSKGVEMYENDVLRDEYGNVGLCHWYYAGWEFINTNGAIESGDRWEVIGTIHDAEYKELAK